MTQKAELIRLVEAVSNSVRSPYYLAEVYAKMDSLYQASFWNSVAAEFERFGPGKGCMQNATIVRDLSDQAKAHIKNLAAHIELIEKERSV